MANQSDFLPIADNTELLLRAALSTLELTLIGAVLGVGIGIIGALIRIGGIRPLAAIFGVYVELIRNTPFLMQLLCIFFGLPSLGVPISGWQAAALAMVINLGAHATDAIHTSLQAFPRPPDEAWRHKVLLPALNNAWPALCNQIIVVMLGSAVCSQIGAQELSFAADVLQSRNLRAFETCALITLMYLCMALMIRQLLNWVGQRFLTRDRAKACAIVPAHE
ncbi:amino acid ABC transporter permease [Pseudomonas putida]|uniref:Amino acid ABC transporter permease n=1 Tax=Pseudomonas putida TaxID=303 RepID=A0A2Z4RLR2_PSEPU|nr:amino acid ABC transporter permease [Pseudomonas putida]AWY41846.1 amino acid ABC transporter permease [Pseudomonas putida]